MADVLMDEVHSIADLVKCGPNEWTITRINVPADHRGEGRGSRLLRQIIDQIDEVGGTLYIQPAATPARGKGLKQLALIRWYKRYGFVWDTQQGVPPRVQMVRRPK